MQITSEFRKESKQNRSSSPHNSPRDRLSPRLHLRYFDSTSLYFHVSTFLRFYVPLKYINFCHFAEFLVCSLLHALTNVKLSPTDEDQAVETCFDGPMFTSLKDYGNFCVT